MFTACIHCNTDLGRNEAFETFPIGTRLAFDAASGRLWVEGVVLIRIGEAQRPEIAAWREAEEIAKVADNLFVLPSVDAQFETLRQVMRPDALARPSSGESGR